MLSPGHILTLTAAVLSTALAAPTSPLSKRASFSYGSDKVRGVNLGGWFVLEPWITPSLFPSGDVVDEYTFSKSLGKDAAKQKLSQHWKSWITQGDFNAIAKAGLNHVRIPIGYWAINPRNEDPYVQGQLDVLDSAIKWARSANLKVMLDLHGAPESQNGFDNSGKLGPVGWLSGSTASDTVTAIKKLSDRYKGDNDVVASIEVLNEPLAEQLSIDGVKQYYTDAIASLAGNVKSVFHDGFKDYATFWNGQYTDSVLDTHQYQVFTPELVAQKPPDHVKAACENGPKLSGNSHPTIVGEWSGALTDCAKYLNGRNKGARYDGTFSNDQGGSYYVGDCKGKYEGTVEGLISDDKKNIRSYVEAQLDAYEQGAGWVFWTWKTEGAPEWDMQDLIKGGLFPQPLSERQYKGQCG